MSAANIGPVERDDLQVNDELDNELAEQLRAGGIEEMSADEVAEEMRALGLDPDTANDAAVQIVESREETAAPAVRGSRQDAVRWVLSNGSRSKSEIMKTLVTQFGLVTAEVYQIMKVTHPNTSYQVIRNTLASANLHRKKEDATGSTAKNGFNPDLSLQSPGIQALIAKLGS
jgi:hypothetical protein